MKHPILQTSGERITLICGHYGVGKTNLALNVVLDMAKEGKDVTLVDMDVVNPYFRSSDYEALLSEAHIRLVTPVFAGSNTSLDVPSQKSEVMGAIELAAAGKTHLIIDVGGDDVGATALCRYVPMIEDAGYEFWYVINRYRIGSENPEDTVELLREIEVRTGLHATGIINNSHMMGETTEDHIIDSLAYADDISVQTNLPILATCYPDFLENNEITIENRMDGRINTTFGRETLQTLLVNPYPVHKLVKTPWE
ncbi:MAG: ParA family protein [Eggerthellaceae bacterium]|nr:ParA family protein [Eggerthellaceae bacterium]